VCKESERYSSPAAQLTDRAIGLAIALRVVSGADASLAPRCNSASTDRPVSMVTMISALIPGARKSDSSAQPLPSWRAKARHPRLQRCQQGKVVDADLRRHDGYGTVRTSVFRALGIRHELCHLRREGGGHRPCVNHFAFW
jgi:hypothetical protein